MAKVDAGTLKEGHCIVIEGAPCKIVEVEKSKPGKHGAAKVRIVAIGLFDGVRRSLVSPADAKVEVPIIEKRRGQVISTAPRVVQLMDLETYDVFWADMPDEEELKSRLSVGAEVEYWRAMGKSKIMRVRG